MLVDTTYLSAETITIAGMIGIVSAYVVYNLFFHPLARVPGPFLCRCGVYRCDFYYAAIRESSFRFEALHFKYGPYVRVGPNHVVTVDPEAYKELYGAQTKWRKANMYKFFAIGATKNLISEIDESKHSVMRRTLAHGYSDSSLRQLEPQIDEMINLLDMKLQPIIKGGQPWNAGDWLKMFSIDVKCMLAFGKAYGLMESEEDEYGLMKAMDLNLYFSILQGMLPTWIGRLWRSSMFAIAPLLSRGPVVLRSFTIQNVKERMQSTKQAEKEEEEESDILAFFIKSKEAKSGRSLSFAELCTHTATIIGGGADSTSIAMRSILYYTLTNPKVYEKVMHELKEAVEEGQVTFPISHAQSTKLSYLQATIRESMRHFAGGGFPLPRISPPSGAVLGGYFIPEGTQVGIHGHSFHRRAFGPDGHLFRPERWLRGDDEDEENFRERTKPMHANFMSFGSGSHTCVGRTIAMMEMSKLIPHLYWHYEMKVTPREPNSPHKYPYGRGLDGVRNGEIWYVQSAWISQQRDFYLNIKRRSTPA